MIRVVAGSTGEVALLFQTPGPDSLSGSVPLSSNEARELALKLLWAALPDHWEAYEEGRATAEDVLNALEAR